MNRRDLAKLIGLNIASRRAQAHRSQDWLAGEVGVCRATLNRIENGHRLAPLDVLVAASGALECPLTALLWGLDVEAVAA